MRGRGVQSRAEYSIIDWGRIILVSIFVGLVVLFSYNGIIGERFFPLAAGVMGGVQILFELLGNKIKDDIRRE